jgi:predicted SprT family Zn-dependent metalloprotease
MDPQEALVLARRLLDEHGLRDWGVTLDSARTRAGLCRFDRKLVSLSRHLTRLHTLDEVADTVLHEVAHALVGPAHGHDAVWRAQARRIGATGERCVPPDRPRVPGEWRGRCAAGHETTAHRRPLRVKSCARCSSGFSLDAVFTWTHRGRPAPMHPRYLAELARLHRPAA